MAENDRPSGIINGDLFGHCLRLVVLGVVYTCFVKFFSASISLKVFIFSFLVGSYFGDVELVSGGSGGFSAGGGI